MSIDPITAQPIYDALHTICTNSHSIVDNSSNKVLLMFDEFARRENSEGRSVTVHAKNTLIAFQKKYLFAAMAIEQMWCISTISSSTTSLS